MKWSQQYKDLGDAIFKAKTDASNVDLLYGRVNLTPVIKLYRGRFGRWRAPLFPCGR